jgi:large subunit ribosomal protein LX
MGMTDYTVSGQWQGRDGWQPFETEISAPNEDVAEERTFSTFGSRHGLKRRQIEIEEVST